MKKSIEIFNLTNQTAIDNITSQIPHAISSHTTRKILDIKDATN